MTNRRRVWFHRTLILWALGSLAVGVGLVAPTRAVADGCCGGTLDVRAVIPPLEGNDPATNTIAIGNGNVTVEERTTTVSTESWSGYNASFVFDSSALTWVSMTDETTPDAWGGSSLCSSVAPSDFLGSLTPPLMGVVISCSASGGGPTSTYIGVLANAVFTPIAVGTTAVHMVEPIEAGPAPARSARTPLTPSPATSRTTHTPAPRAV